MFNHLKRVKHYTIFACYVYDSRYCKVVTIALCDMMSETDDAQTYLWHGVDGAMVEYEVHNVNFKVFMADSIHANRNVVCEIYDTSDNTVPMRGNAKGYQSIHQAWA